jgi:hypothetical protein
LFGSIGSNIFRQPPAGASPTRHGMIGKTAAILEKLEEAS